MRISLSIAVADVTLEEMLAQARRKLRRVSAEDAPQALGEGAVLVDIRSDAQRARDGVVPLARFIPRNELEWRCAPTSAWRAPEVSDPQRRVIVMCNEGYQSSLAAATLQELGLPRATDLVGGF